MNLQKQSEGPKVSVVQETDDPHIIRIDLQYVDEITKEYIIVNNKKLSIGDIIEEYEIKDIQIDGEHAKITGNSKV